MIANDKHQSTNDFVIAITIEFHISCQYAILSEIISNITLHDSNYNRILRHFVPEWLLMINMNSK